MQISRIRPRYFLFFIRYLDKDIQQLQHSVLVDYRIDYGQRILQFQMF